MKCDVHYNMEAWGRVTPPLLNMVRQSPGFFIGTLGGVRGVEV